MPNGRCEGLARMAHASDVARWHADHGLQMPVSSMYRGGFRLFAAFNKVRVNFPERSSGWPSDHAVLNMAAVRIGKRTATAPGSCQNLRV